MNITVSSLIGNLPPYQDQWQIIKPQQTVKDIMVEVLTAHNEFASYYNDIALFFDAENTPAICDKIYWFLKDNIKYHEESEADQTSALPSGILTRLKGDCKHYAGFAGGILDALNRSGKRIDWKYIFASYRIFDSVPHHVFIEVVENGENIWIDPTPGSEKKNPVWITAKKIKAIMLRRNIAGIYDDPGEGLEVDEMGIMGKRPFWQLMPAEGVRGKDGNHGSNQYFSGPFLALQHYAEDPYSIEGTNWNTTADAINAAITNGPAPGHSVNGQFVKWIYDHSMKGWNFYYPMGVIPEFMPQLPSWYPHLLINTDNKLVFDRIYKVDDFMNDEIHALTAWAQSLINDHSATPYPITPRQVKEYSQGILGNDDDLFTEDRGKGFLKDAFGFVKKIGLSGARNAYLGLIGLNAFGMASKLSNALYNDDQKIDPDAYTKIMDKWQKFGGDPDKLQNTIDHGAKKKALLGNIISGPEVALPVWVAVASALIAAIGPVVENILGKKKEQTGIDYNVDPTTGKPFPPVPITGDTGLPAVDNIINKIKDNPIPAVAMAAGAFLLLRKKKQVNGIQDKLLPLALIGYGAYILFFKKSGTIHPPLPEDLTPGEKIQALISYQPNDRKWTETIFKMDNQEISDTYQLIFVYINEKNKIPVD
jgi:hypothetical protein